MDRREYVLLKRQNRGKLPSFAWPGGYQMYYLCEDGGYLCPNCANDDRVREEMRIPARNFPDKSWRISRVGINLEDNSLYCDNCNQQIEPSYQEDN